MRRLALLVLGPLLLAAAPLTDDPGTARVRLICTHYAETSHGAVLFHVATQTEIHGGPIHRSEQSEAIYVSLDGGVVRKRYLHFRQNGRDLKPSDLAEKGEEVETPLSRFGLRLPYLRAVVADYRFDPPIDRGASIDIPFHALVRDQSHGDGLMTIDRANERIERIDERPAAMPPRADSGNVTVLFGPVGPDRWDITEIDHDFAGHAGFIHGTLRSNSHYDKYVPFPDQARALSALAATDG